MKSTTIAALHCRRYCRPERLRQHHFVSDPYRQPYSNTDLQLVRQPCVASAATAPSTRSRSPVRRSARPAAPAQSSAAWSAHWSATRSAAAAAVPQPPSPARRRRGDRQQCREATAARRPRHVPDQHPHGQRRISHRDAGQRRMTCAWATACAWSMAASIAINRRRPARPRSEPIDRYKDPMGTILLIILILALVGVLPTWNAQPQLGLWAGQHHRPAGAGADRSCCSPGGFERSQTTGASAPVFIWHAMRPSEQGAAMNT